MKKLALLIIVINLSLTSFCQNVKKDVYGNYTAIAKIKKDSATNTGKTYTDNKGSIFPVFISNRGKIYIVRTSKTGNIYKMYLSI